MKKLLILIISLALFIPSVSFAAKAFDKDTGGTLTTGLQAWYNLEADGTDEFSTNNMTGTGGPTFTTGKIGNAVSVVRASTQYESIASSLGYSGSSYSISGWIYVTSTPASGQLYTLADVSETTNNTDLWIGYYNNAGTPSIFAARTRHGTADDGPITAQTLTLNTWYHWAVTYDGANVRSYLNGSLLGGPTAASGTGGVGTATVAYIGTGGAGNTAHLFDGRLDLVGYWNKALSTTEISDLYNGGAGNAYRTQATAAACRIRQIGRCH